MATDVSKAEESSRCWLSVQQRAPICAMRKGRLKRPSPRKQEMSPSRNRSPVSTVSSSSRSPSPLGRPEAPAAYLTTGQKYYVHAAKERGAGTCSESPGGQDGIIISPGIRYITESLIKKLSKQENLGRVTTLYLSLAKDGGRKFKYIENLEKCDKLEVLNLSNNLIEKIEKLDKLLKLCDLNLSYNKITKIEGIEHLHNLQKLNLAGNDIEHIPAWMGKKLRSLRILNLRKNRISSLQELAKLKPLKDLTSLFLADNPVVNLPHYRLYTIFHLRSLEDLDGQPVTNCDREEALERFNIEEVENLEKVLEKTVKEVEDLKTQQANLLKQLKEQDDLNKSLREKHLQQKASCKDLESELETKNELFFLPLPIGTLLHALLQLKQKTVELTRACQKQYELEQELAFYKIDAKFEPLGYYPVEDIELDNMPGESPYIGKSRYKRNMYVVEGYIPNRAQKIQVGNLEKEEQETSQKLKLNLLQSLDVQLEEKELKIKEAQEKLAELHDDIANAEQRILKATEELKQVQDATAQKKMSEAEKDCLRQQLSNKILLLNQLRQEALGLEEEIKRQNNDMSRKEKELENLQSFLGSLDPADPRHAHVKAQRMSKEEQLDMMSKYDKQLESRLDDMLTRIAKETEEIRDLEQQLTDGQIAANDALKRDLEGIIVGLQEYLESVKDQAKQASDECKELRKDKKTLLQKLEEVERERNHLEIVATDAENLKKEVADLEQALQEQQELNDVLQGNQAELSAYGDELEAELNARNAEASQHKEDLERLKQLSQLENSALKAELDKEKQALEDALTKVQLLKDREQENNDLLSQLKQLQKDNNLLKQQLRETENQLNHAIDNLIHPEEVLAHVNELKQKLQSDAEIRCHSPNDILGNILADLLKHFREILAQSQHENKALQNEIASQQAKMEEAQEKYRLACEKAMETKIKSGKKQNEARIRQLENEIVRLSEKLKAMEEIQGLTDQQLQEADEEKERILIQLEDLENRKKVEDAKAQIQLLGIDKELWELKRAVAASDKQATANLCAAKDQLRSLHGTVHKINQEHNEELQEAEKFRVQAAQAAKDIAKAEAEIDLLQKLMEEKQKQFQYEMEKANAEIAASDFLKEEIERLNQLLKDQKTEIERLHMALNCARAGSREEIDSILNEISALKNAILHQNDTISSILDPFKQKGHLYYMPTSSQASTLASQSTKDSGVGLQRHTSTPVEKRDREGKQSKKVLPIFPSPNECWLHAPVRNGLHETPSQGENQEDVETNTHSAASFLPPPGSVIYTVLPDDVLASQGPGVNGGSSVLTSRGQPPPATFICGSHAGAPLLCAKCLVHLVPVGVLHCNIPEHLNLENQILKLQDRIDKLRCESRRLGRSHHEHNKEMEELHQGIQELRSERKELENQISELRKIAQKRKKRKDFVDGPLGGSISEQELENSLQHHDNITEEIECVEKTLLKRRAELREADRLLAEAERELENTYIKIKDTAQKYSSAKKRLSQTEKEAEELEQRAQEMAVRLVKADQQLRLLHEDTKDLEQHKVEQEGILKEINKVVCAKDSEFQSLSQKTEILTESLQKLQADIQVSEGNEHHHLEILKEAESILQSKKSELERLNNQIAAQHKELVILDRLLSQKKEELHLLQNSLMRTKADLTDVLRDGEAEVAEKQQRIKEVKSFLEDLSVQKGELNAQLSERRTQLSLVVQDIQKEQEKLQDFLGEIIKHKSELKHVREMLRLEHGELDGIILQHNQKVDELEKLQVAVLEKKLELENLQRLSLQQRGEAEHQRQLNERAQQEAEQLNSQFHLLQNGIKLLSSEKQQLEESCADLEKRVSEAKRTLAAIEDNKKATQTSTEKMGLEVQKLQLEIDHLEEHKLALNGDIAMLQKQLHEKKEELNVLKIELNDSRQDLQILEQNLQHFREGAQHEEKKLEDCTAKLKDQKQYLEREVTEQQNQLEQVVAKVQGAEERIQKLQQEGSWCAGLEETVDKARYQLSEKEAKLQEKVSEVLSLQRELEFSKVKEFALQDQIQTERKNTEKQIAGLREAIRTQKDHLERALHEQKQENHSLQKEVALMEQVAKDNKLRSKKLMGELIQIQDKYMRLRSQMKSQEDLEKRQKEVKGTVKTLKLEVKDKIRNGLKDLSQSPGLLQDLEMASEARRFQSDLESLKENYPFTDNEGRVMYFDGKLDLSKVQITDEQWRGQAHREQLQHQEDRLKAQLQHCMLKQVEVLFKGKQETEGTIHSLKRQVDALDELVSNTSTDTLFPSVNTSWLTDSLQEELSTVNSQFTRSPCRTATDFSSQPEVTHLSKA